LDSLLHDLRLGLRLLVRHRGFSGLAILVLGAGIGIVTTVASVANALLLRPPAVADPASMVRVFSGRYSGTSLLDLLAYEEASTTLAGIAAFREARVSVRVGGQDSRPLFATLVTGNFFDVLGVEAWRGRTFLPDEGRTPGTSPVAILSHRAWQREFADDLGIVGRPVTMNGQAFTVIGIMPPSFNGAWGPVGTDLWLPLTMHPVLQPGARTFVDRDAFYAQAVARLRPGVTLARAQSEADARYQRWQADGAAASRERSALRLYPLHFLVPELWERAAVFLAIVGGLTISMLGIVCLNVANLTLARHSSRRGEFGVRVALGAGRRRLVRQLLVESGCLAAAGTVLGAGVALFLSRLIGQWTPPAPVPILLDVTPDWRVLVTVGLIGGLTTILIGLAPAWTTTRRTAAPTMNEHSVRTTGAGRARLRATLLVAQVSLSLLLLAVAGLLVRSLSHAERMDLGFEPGGVLLTSLDLDVRAYDPTRGRRLYADLVRGVRALPGVRDASVLDIVPLTGTSRGSTMRKEGVPSPPPGQTAGLVAVGRKSVGDRHFATLRIPLLSGRDFTGADDDGAPGVAIVNETLARTFWPGESPIGRRLRLHDPAQPDTPLLEVVGLVRDSRYATVGESPRPFMYRPLAQEYSADASLVVRAEGDPLALARPVRERLRQLDPDLPIFEMRRLDEATGIALLPIRLAAGVVAALAVAVLGLAAMGIYGVNAYVAGQRTREFGIMMALGADRRSILWMVLREALRWVSVGAAAGLGLALLATPLVSSLLYGIGPHDPRTLSAVVALLVLVGTASALVPAIRASRHSPAEALRHD
jgi:predicted permease